jgi:oligoendopeptidase F
MIKVYLDNCVYNRPFDDQSNERIFIEARAFYIILTWIEEGKIMTINSDALEYENSITSNPDRRMRIETYLALAKVYTKFSESLTKRAKEIIGLGIRNMDALHIAMAEYEKSEYFVICDDDIIKKVKKSLGEFKVKICSILEFLEEVRRYGKDNH